MSVSTASHFSTTYESPRNVTWDQGYRTFSAGLYNDNYPASLIWHEAQWADVLFDAHAMNATYPVGVAPVELSASERDMGAALRQATALNASAAQANKLRAIIEQRRDALAHVATLQTQLALSQQTLTGLRDEQITGNDSRLENFWERAMQKANDENFCSEYDRMAEALDGPRRTTPGVATVRVVAYVNISVDDIESYDIDDYEVFDAVTSLDSSDFNWEVQDTTAD